MKKDINLLPQLKEESDKEKKIKKYLTVGSPIILVLYGLLLVVVYIYWNIQISAANDINNKISGAEKSISEQKEVESLYRGTKTKISGVSQLLGQHLNYAQIIAHIEQIAPADISLTSLVIKDDGTIEISLQASNSVILAAFINALLDNNSGGKYFSHAKLTSLVFSADGTYLFSLSFQSNPKS